MVTISSMYIDWSKSDKDVDGGLTFKGTYHVARYGTPDGSEYGFVFLKDGVEIPIVGTMTVSPVSILLSGDFTFTVTAEAAAQAGIPLGSNTTLYATYAGVRFPEQSGTTTFLCFYSGTLIATPSGDVAVEQLSVGDLLLRHDGTVSPIRWIGRKTVAIPFADPAKALPIRIRKDALAYNVPCRDLLVSPDHAVLIDGILVQAGALVNGASIVREADVPSTFVYYHIEIADHALIMAENTPAETFIDNVDRMVFDNWAEHQSLYGDRPPLAELDMPRAKSQRQIPSATRQRLAERAARLGHPSATAAA